MERVEAVEGGERGGNACGGWWEGKPARVGEFRRRRGARLGSCEGPLATGGGVLEAEGYCGSGGGNGSLRGCGKARMCIWEPMLALTPNPSFLYFRIRFSQT